MNRKKRKGTTAQAPRRTRNAKPDVVAELKKVSEKQLRQARGGDESGIWICRLCSRCFVTCY